MFIRLISGLKNSFKFLPTSLFQNKNQISPEQVKKLFAEGQEKLNNPKNFLEAIELIKKSINLSPKAPLKQSDLQLQVA